MSQTRIKPDGESTYRTPRWVKTFGITVLALILLVGAIVITGIGGEHGPDRHFPTPTPTVKVLPQ